MSSGRDPSCFDNGVIIRAILLHSNHQSEKRHYAAIVFKPLCQENLATMAVLSTSATKLRPDMIPTSSQILSLSTLARTGILVLTFSLILLVYTWLRSIYRVHFHPLAHFPGPREAAISRDWELKIATEKADIPSKCLRGCISNTVINVSFPNPKYRKPCSRSDRHACSSHRTQRSPSRRVSLYKIIYSQTTKYFKDPGFYDAFNSHQTVFGQYDPQLHRQRRKMMKHMFSRGGIFKLEGLINDKCEIKEKKILRLGGKGSSSIDAYDAFRALTTEIIAQFSFSRSAGLIEESSESFKSSTVNGIGGTADGVTYMRHSWILRAIAAMLPRRLVKRFGGDVGQFMNLLDVSFQAHFFSFVSSVVA